MKYVQLNTAGGGTAQFQVDSIKMIEAHGNGELPGGALAILKIDTQYGMQDVPVQQLHDEVVRRIGLLYPPQA